MDALPGGIGHQRGQIAGRRVARLLATVGGAVVAPPGGHWLDEDPIADRSSPTLLTPEPVSAGWGRHPIPHAVTSDITDFLDGIQRVRIAGWIAGLPVVTATVAATIRHRAGRQLVDGGTVIRSLVLAPDGLLSADLTEALRAEGCEPISTGDSPHPVLARAQAINLVSTLRAACERELAEWWVTHRPPEARLLLDGGLAVSEPVASDRRVVGVVKSHGSWYGADDNGATLRQLQVGERTSVLLHRRSERVPAVWSWYLRLHAATSGDPAFGLVRVEHAAQSSPAAAEGTADRWAGWLLAERVPVALPDARWDRLLYGVAACERYLSARVG